MILKRLLITLLLHAFLLSTNLSWAQSERDFALSLYRSGEYEYSSIELRRWLHFNRNDPFAPYMQYLLALSYGRLGRYAEAASTLRDLIESLTELGEGSSYDKLLCECHLQLLNLHFRERRFDDFFIEKESFAISCIDPEQRLEAAAQRMAVAVHVYSRSWDEALLALGEADLLDRETFEEASREIAEMNEYKPRSPVLGGILSLLPGLGHLYGGLGAAGFRSFFINAACVGVTVFCFVMGMPVLGMLFAVIECVLYFSNIYGGVNAVIRYNTDFVLERRDSILIMLTIPPLDVITLREQVYGQ